MNPNAELNVIAALDLNLIKVKLMHKESGEGWSPEQVTEVEFEYRRFLCLLKRFPEEQIAPRFDVDIFWHYHILDTMKYAADCEQLFGYFLHHYPYSGLGGEDDAADHSRTASRTQELYEATFGEVYIRKEKAGAKAMYAKAIAQNDMSYSIRSASRSAMAWCETVAGNARPYSVRSVSWVAKIAWCETAARPVSRAANAAWCETMARPVTGAASAAWCETVVRPASGSAIAAWCETVAQNDRLAWCETVAQNDHVGEARAMLAIAA